MVAGLATLATFDDENIVERARLTGVDFAAALQPLVERYEMFHEVRGKGLMIGLQFGPPTSKGLRRRYQTLERLRPAIFTQMVVVPLFHRHRILTQVAADNVNIIKLLPALICGQEEIDYFVGRAGRCAQGCARAAHGLLFEFGRTMANGCAPAVRKAAAQIPLRAPYPHGTATGTARMRATALRPDR